MINEICGETLIKCWRILSHFWENHSQLISLTQWDCRPRKYMRSRRMKCLKLDLLVKQQLSKNMKIRYYQRFTLNPIGLLIISIVPWGKWGYYEGFQVQSAHFHPLEEEYSPGIESWSKRFDWERRCHQKPATLLFIEGFKVKAKAYNGWQHITWVYCTWCRRFKYGRTSYM